MTTQTIERGALTAEEITVEEMRALAARAARRHPNFREPINPPHVLRSHGVPIAVRMNNWVAVAAKPSAPGQPCLGRVMAHVGRAAVFIHAVFADERVFSFNRADFAELCRHYCVKDERPMRQPNCVRCERSPS